MKQITMGLIALTLLASCARELCPDVYSDRCIDAPSKTFSGTVRNMRCVSVTENDRLQENGLGLIAGGVLGGVAGNMLGKGKGNTLATVGGAVAGATAGAMTEKKLKEQNAMEYVVELDDGSLMTVVQGLKPTLQTGQKVYVMVSQQGRSRIVCQ